MPLFLSWCLCFSQIFFQFYFYYIRAFKWENACFWFFFFSWLDPIVDQLLSLLPLSWDSIASAEPCTETRGIYSTSIPHSRVSYQGCRSSKLRSRSDLLSELSFLILEDSPPGPAMDTPDLVQMDFSLVYCLSSNPDLAQSRSPATGTCLPLSIS